VGKALSLFNKKSSLNEDGLICHCKSKHGIKMELFDKAHTFGRFLNQRHVGSARGFAMPYRVGAGRGPVHSARVLMVGIYVVNQ
jgi:hypothetical protein